MSDPQTTTPPTPEQRAEPLMPPVPRDVDAAYKFAEDMVDRADDKSPIGPTWHAWALVSAFLEGVEHARRNAT